MTAALAFFFIAVFGDAVHAWTIQGPYRSFAACSREAEGYAHLYPVDIHISEVPATSRCYAQ